MYHLLSQRMTIQPVAPNHDATKNKQLHHTIHKLEGLKRYNYETRKMRNGSPGHVLAIRHGGVVLGRKVFSQLPATALGDLRGPTEAARSARGAPNLSWEAGSMNGFLKARIGHQSPCHPYQPSSLS